jgi:hypothetical protein
MENDQKFQDDAEVIISICEKIIQQHAVMGPRSPISNGVIANLSLRIASAKEKNNEAMKYKKLMEDALHGRDYFLGSGSKSIVSILKAIHNTLEEQNINVNNWGL